MPKQRPKKQAPSENDVAFRDPKPKLSPKDRFWKLANQYLRYQMNNPWDWMNADDSQEAAQESHEDYLDFLESQTPGQGQYVGDYGLNQQGQVVPEGQAVPGSSQTASGGSYGSLGGQITPEGLFPAEGATAPLPGVTGATGTDLAFANAQGAAPQTVMPTNFEGAPQDQVALAQQYGQQYGVDPGLLLAIAKHETNFGTLGLGKKGLTLGYGAFDSGPSMQWAGNENQYRHGAQTLSKWGANTIDDVLAGKASSWATDPKWEAGIQRAYGSLAPQLAQGPTDVFDQILSGIEKGTVDPKVLDTLGPGLSSLADQTSKTADSAEAMAQGDYDTSTDEDEEDDDE